MKVEKLWGGRFEELPSKEMVEFLSGRDVRGVPPCDERLIPYDLWGNRAHVLMLCRQGILSKQDGKRILNGLKEIEALYRKGKFALDPSKEDVHSNIESYLIERVGIESGGKIHTGRSRNDQIVLDMRLYLRDQTLEFVEGLTFLILALLQKAGEHRSTVMPGYTHHQHAVPTTFGHLLLSFGEALDRDAQRFIHWFGLFNKNPLGAAAAYGTSFNLDRQLTSKLMGFDGPTENVTDPITQRWEPEAELAYGAAMTMDHLSTMAQTLILLSTREFNMVRLNDRHCSGSSIMPQKRNPCSLEVIKAKTSFVHGMVISLLSVGKSLFMGYNRDTQWTKYWIMDLVDESKPSLSVMTDIIRLLEVNEAQMSKQAQEEFLGATALMEWLVRHGSLPMRKAKIVMEKAVKYSEKEGKGKVSYQSLKKALAEMEIDIPITQGDVERMQRPETILARALSIGTPLERRVKENIVSLQKKVQAKRNWLALKKRGIKGAKDRLFRMEKELSSRMRSQRIE
ncbi:MAG TPA: argininosuccinate lyase [Thermodesulfobacteriota bacterium]|nr:argininosuccinate lyase [Thermodesulfobacteriota bacterium]